MENFETTYHIFCLKKTFERKKVRNPNLSLRSFAKFIGVTAPSLVQVMGGKRPLSMKMAEKILPHLGLDAKEQSQFYKSLLETHNKRNLKRLDPRLRKAMQKPKDFEIEQENYRIVGEWTYYALIEMTELENFRFEYSWMAKKLGIRQEQVIQRVDDLIGLGVLAIDCAGKLYKKHEFITSKNKNKTSASLKKLQQDFIEKAKRSLLDDPIQTRCINSMTMPIDVDKVEMARQMISDFAHELASVMSTGETTQVYNLNINFYPLTKPNDSLENL